jgi:hypothetical protein
LLLNVLYLVANVSVICSVFFYSFSTEPRLLHVSAQTFQGVQGFLTMGLAQAAIIVGACVLTTAAFAFGESGRDVRFRVMHYPISQACVAAVATLLSGAIAYFVLDAFANSADEFVYLFQAEIFKSGRLFAEQPPVQDVFSTVYLIEREGRWLGQYPPGWPALLASWQLLGLPVWLLNPVLGAASIFVLFRIAAQTMDRSAALLTATFYAASIFFLFESASLFSHQAFSLCSLLFAFFLVKFDRDKRTINLLLAGFAISVAFSIRYFPAVLLAVAAAGAILWRPNQVRVLLALAAGALAVFVLVLLYHYAVFDNPLTTGYSWRPGAYKKFAIAPLDALKNIAIQLWELANWTSPLLPLLYGTAIVLKVRARALSFVDFFFPALVAGFFFFPDVGGNRYGPRYLYDAYPFMVLTIGTALFPLLSSDRTSSLARGINAALVVSLLYTASALPFVAHYYNQVVEERRDVYRLVERSGITNAVVLIESPTGYRLPMGLTDLARNDPDMRNDVLFAYKTTPAILRATLPGRTVWIYRCEKDAKAGHLIRTDEG